MLARVSWDGGQTWEPELYKLTRGHGYSGSVVLKDGTIVTLAGDGQLSRAAAPPAAATPCRPSAGNPGPRGERVGIRETEGLPPPSPSMRTSVTTPAVRKRCLCGSLPPPSSAFPITQVGRPLHYPFRGLLDVRSRSGPHVR